MLEPIRAPDEETTLEDEAFDQVFPPPLQRLSARHWTPVAVARRAAQLLVRSAATTVLDVGAGVGKFCIIGASTTPARFVAAERRAFLATVARGAVRRSGVPRVQVIHGDALTLDWQGFDGFYFFNPFLDPALDAVAIRQTERKLAEARPGARVVTYHGFGGVMPPCFRLSVSEAGHAGRLELFVKQSP